MPPARVQCRGWSFTLNNYSPEDVEYLFSNGESLGAGDVALVDEAIAVRGNPVMYLGFQPEIGAEGTPHLQGFVYFRNGRELGGVRKWFGAPEFCNGIHLESIKGTPQQNVAYISKEESRDGGAVRSDGSSFGFVFFGTVPEGAGKRTDLESIAVAIKGGKKARAIFEADGAGYIKFHGGIGKAIQLMESPRDFKTSVHWFWGPTGSGKSRAAQEAAPDAYWKNAGDAWWDGYIGQEVVIIDDYRKDFCKFSELLRLLDRYPLRLQIKGGTVEFVARHIYITCPLAPIAIWESRTEEDIAQLTRRIEEVRNFV